MYKCNSLREVEPLTTPVAFFSGFVTETAPTVLTGPKSNEQVFIINKFNRFRQSPLVHSEFGAQDLLHGF